jgi:hypothetical protein
MDTEPSLLSHERKKPGDLQDLSSYFKDLHDLLWKQELNDAAIACRGRNDVILTFHRHF